MLRRLPFLLALAAFAGLAGAETSAQKSSNSKSPEATKAKASRPSNDDGEKARNPPPSTPEPRPSATPAATVVTPLDPTELRNFDANPPAVRALLEKALALTKQNLGYKFGSADPAAGGMDCSGTIYHVLRASGLADVPRSASDQYVWARKADTFESVVSRDPETFELEALRPGDLLFWTGTYATPNDPPVTHTMIYLGELKRDGRPVMFGASDGRSYGGKKMWGVSVFDFKLPKAPVKGAPPGSVFIGYAPIPGLAGAAPAEPTPAPPRPRRDEP